MSLSGRTVAVTRPAMQSAALLSAFVACGANVLAVPLLEIAPLEDDARLHAVAARLEQYHYAFFVSANAVAFACPVLLARRPWPPQLRALCPGPGTARALEPYGITDPVVAAEPFDSETLLDHPLLDREHLRGARVVIFRGERGRDFMSLELARRGARVEQVSCYRRAAAQDLSSLDRALLEGNLDGITLTSSEALRGLLAGLDPRALQRARAAVPMFATHQRIADAAQQAGFKTVVKTPPGDAGLVAAVEQYFADHPG